MDAYAITYNPATHLFDVTHCGAWIDSVPSYADGDSTIELHRALVDAEAASEPVCPSCGDATPFGGLCGACAEGGVCPHCGGDGCACAADFHPDYVFLITAA